MTYVVDIDDANAPALERFLDSISTSYYKKENISADCSRRESEMDSDTERAIDLLLALSEKDIEEGRVISQEEIEAKDPAWRS